MARPKRTRDVRRRLLDAAGELIAEHGYRAVGVRAICRRAQVNVAAAHYHFGGKRELYEELVRRSCREVLESHPLEQGLDAGSLEQRLAGFVLAFVSRHRSGAASGAPWRGRLLARELLEPSEACEHVLETQLRPLFKRVCALAAEGLGTRAEPELAILCARSIVAQCLFFEHARPLASRLSASERESPEALARWAEHVARFSRLALEGLGRDRARLRARA